jgi:hypothetical protein
MHQAGLAVDVSCAVSADHVLGNNQGTGRQPLDACWPWVSANSYRFALLDQYATHPESWAEGWHLSPDSK